MLTKPLLVFIGIVFFALVACDDTNIDEISSDEPRGAAYQATRTAEVELHDFLERALTPHAMKMYGLEAEDSADNATLGKPLQLHLIDPQKVNSCVELKCVSVDHIALAIETYLFPVKFNGKPKLLISVDRYQGAEHFEIGSLGYRWLARELALIERHWPLREGFTMRLFKSNQGQVYAFSIAEKGSFNLTLIDPNNTKTNRYQELSTLANVLPDLQHRIETMLQSGVWL